MGGSAGVRWQSFLFLQYCVSFICVLCDICERLLFSRQVIIPLADSADCADLFMQNLEVSEKVFIFATKIESNTIATCWYFKNVLSN